MSKPVPARAAPAATPASLVQRIFASVLHDIHTRPVAPGSRLPSVRQLAADRKVSRDTAARVYDALVAQGHVESRRGSGYFVRSPRSGDGWLSARGLAGAAGAASGAAVPLRQLHLGANLDGQPGAGHLPLAWQDEAALGAAFRAIGRTRARALAGHADAQGYLPLRRQLCLMMEERGIHAAPEQVLVTAGAAEALHLVILANVRPAGAYVLVEEPTSPIVVERLLAAGQGFLPVPRGSDGPDVKRLRELCEQHRPKFFFCHSILHNPTSSNLSPHKAFQILQLAEEFDLTVVEDDSYGDLLSPAAMPGVARMATLDQLRRVIYVGSLSKTLGTGLRTGFLAASAAQTRWLLMWRLATTIAGSALTERVVYEMLSKGGYRHHCEQLRMRLDERRDALAKQLASLGIGLAGGTAPVSGMYLWADLGPARDAQSLAASLAEQGHAMAPGRLFSVTGEASGCMRFNVATSLGHPALAALAKLLRQPPAPA